MTCLALFGLVGVSLLFFRFFYELTNNFDVQAQGRLLLRTCVHHMAASLFLPFYLSFASFLLNMPRELDGFINPCGLQSRVVTGAGAGWQVTTLEKPAPAARV